MSDTNKPKLWHCYNSRSMRPLWALEEMGIDYELEAMDFPPRYLHKGYLEVNSIGTVPYFVDGDTHMTESSGICHYLVERYQQYDFGLRPEHPEYGDYLNWLYHSDATLTFPQTIVLRYKVLEPGRCPEAAEDYAKWYLARLRRVSAHIEGREFLCDDRFTIADIAIGFALFFGETFNFHEQYSPALRDYLERLKARPAFQRCLEIAKDLDPMRHFK